MKTSAHLEKCFIRMRITGWRGGGGGRGGEVELTAIHYSAYRPNVHRTNKVLPHPIDTLNDCNLLSVRRCVETTRQAMECNCAVIWGHSEQIRSSHDVVVVAGEIGLQVNSRAVWRVLWRKDRR